LIYLKDRLLIETRLAFGIDYKEIDMCFGGGGSDPEPVSETVTAEQKEKEEEEKQRTAERRQDEKEDTVTSEGTVETKLTHDTGRKLKRGSRGRLGLYRSGRGGIGHRKSYSSIYGNMG